VRMLDLFCGRFGWSRAFAARGWECVGVDLVEPPEIPQGCTFIRADILQVRYNPNHMCDAFIISDELISPDFVCSSSPCEKFSVFAMPHFHPNPPYPEEGIQLFNHTRAICEASGLPYVMENVRAAQRFVGQAENHCGPFYLWGNAVPPLLPQGIKKGFQTGGQIIQRLKLIDRKALTDYRRQNDGSWSSSKSEKRKEWTAQVATIPPELANCVADYAERILEQKELTR
jgi:hypothetical protein